MGYDETRDMDLEFEPRHSSKEFLADLAYGMTQKNQSYVTLSYLLATLNKEKIVLSPSDVALLETYNDKIPIYYLLNPSEINKLGPKYQQINPWYELGVKHYMDHRYRNVQQPLKVLPEKYLTLTPNVEFQEVLGSDTVPKHYLSYDERNSKKVYNKYHHSIHRPIDVDEDGELTYELQFKGIPESAYDLSDGFVDSVKNDYNIEAKSLPDNNSYLLLTPKYNMNDIRNIRIMNLDQMAKITPVIITHADGTVESVTYNTADLGPGLVNRSKDRKRVNYLKTRLPTIPTFDNITEILNIAKSDRLDRDDVRRLLGEVLENKIQRKPDLFGSKNDISLQYYGSSDPANNISGKQRQLNNERDALAAYDPKFARSLKLRDEAFRAGDVDAYEKVRKLMQYQLDDQKVPLRKYIDSKIPRL